MSQQQDEEWMMGKEPQGRAPRAVRRTEPDEPVVQRFMVAGLTTKPSKLAFKVVKSTMHQEDAPLAVRQGAQPDAQTIIYVHGIGNKPPASVLKCQWDTALFGRELGDRSRLAYWVNRAFYPTPSADTCMTEAIENLDAEETSTRSTMQIIEAASDGLDAGLAAEIAAIAPGDEQRAWLTGLAERMASQADKPQSAVAASGVGARILPLPPFVRRWITRRITRVFLRDVNEFFFDDERRSEMEASLTERLSAGGGPFVVIAHSQGSMIAYNVLRRLPEADRNVKLFLTIGSPLGIAEVRDILKVWSPDGVLRMPPCVERWVNVADARDPVAADTTVADEYEVSAGQKIRDVPVDNAQSPRHPHSGSGYLRVPVVQQVVLETVGNAFVQPVARTIIAKDLVDGIEDGHRLARHPVLIQLAPRNDMPKKDGPKEEMETVDTVRKSLITAIHEMVRTTARSSQSDVKDEIEQAKVEPLKRFVAAHLTRHEIEQLRTCFGDLKVERVWRDAVKRTLVHASVHTIQSRPAVLGYDATGRDIGWAVLDTGIRADHPHFRMHSNVKAQWDCTQAGGARRYTPQDQAFNGLDEHGHGTHVAGIIAGECPSVVLKPGEQPRRFAGVAPQTSLYGFKVLNDQGNGQDSWIIKALDTIADLNESAGRLVIAGVNLSLGGNFDPSVYACGHTPLCQELRRLWNQGVLVCLAAGNEGYALLQTAHGDVPSNLDLSIGDPANLDEAIAVGSIHKTNPHTYGVSYYSSRGPTADGRRKPDLVAPGERILSALHQFKAVDPDPKTGNYAADDLYIEMSGTSMAAPHVSGLLAGFLSVHREFIGYPDRVKRILFDHCIDLGRDPYIQGHGMPNLIGMLANT
jgi:subtilisin family serine protease